MTRFGLRQEGVGLYVPMAFLELVGQQGRLVMGKSDPCGTYKLLDSCAARSAAIWCMARLLPALRTSMVASRR